MPTTKYIILVSYTRSNNFNKIINTQRSLPPSATLLARAGHPSSSTYRFEIFTTTKQPPSPFPLPPPKKKVELYAFCKGDAKAVARAAAGLPNPNVKAESLFNQLKAQRPKNLATFIRRLVIRLETATRASMLDPMDQIQTINAMMILTHLLPHIHEDSSMAQLWMTQTPVGVVNSLEPLAVAKYQAITTPVTAIGAAAAAAEDGAAATTAAPATPRPLGDTLVAALVNLAFCQEFTVPYRAANGKPAVKEYFIAPAIKHEDVIAAVDVEAEINIWTPGVQWPANGGKDPAVPPMMVTARAAIVKLLLVFLSAPLYIPATKLRPRSNRWLAMVVNGALPKTIPFFQSVLNTFLGYDPVGIGMPYGQFFSPDEVAERLAEMCGQLVLLLADHWPLPRPGTVAALQRANAAAAGAGATAPRTGEGAGADGGAEENATDDVATPSAVQALDAPAGAPAPAEQQQQQPVRPPWETYENLVAAYLSDIDVAGDLTYMVDSMHRLLETSLQDTWLPESQKRISCHQELFGLLWRLLETNPAFRAEFVTSPKGLSIVAALLHHMQCVRKRAAQYGFLRIGIHILVLLSAERNFAVALNKEFVATFELSVPCFEGGYADLLVMVTHDLLLAINPPLVGLYGLLMTVLVNVSPYLKGLGYTAANRLVHIVETFSSSAFLFAAPDNYELLFILLETINNLVQYQFEGNTHLVYATNSPTHFGVLLTRGH